MIKYRAYNLSIEKMECVKETQHTVTFRSNSGKEYIEKKKAGYYTWHDSFEEAKEYLLQKEKENIGKYKAFIALHEKSIEEILRLKEE